LPDHVARNVDGTGGDRVHADIVLGGLQCRGLGKRDYCSLGRCIKTIAGYTRPSPRAAPVTTTTLPVNESVPALARRWPCRCSSVVAIGAIVRTFQSRSMLQQ
jgi:hypothetical protein